MKYNKKFLASLIYRISIVLIGIAGIVLSAIPSDSTTDMMGKSTFSYYTIQSNILVTVFFTFLIVYQVVKYIKKQPFDHYGRALTLTKGAVMQAITVTCIIFWTLLFPFVLTDGHVEYLMSFRNFTVHLIVPLLALLDWVMFDIKGKMQRYDPLLWLLIPLVYYLYAIIAANSGVIFADGARYPYFFINPDVIGYGGVAIAVFGILAFFTALGYTLYYIDVKCSKKCS